MRTTRQNNNIIYRDLEAARGHAKTGPPIRRDNVSWYVIPKAGQ